MNNRFAFILFISVLFFIGCATATQVTEQENRIVAVEATLAALTGQEATPVNNTNLPTSDELPAETHSLIFSSAQSSISQCQNGECQDFKITCAQKLEVSAADQANGIEEKWCASTSFIYPYRDTWYDESRWRELIKRDGNWQVEGFGCTCNAE